MMTFHQLRKGAVLDHMVSILCPCWKEESVSQDMGDGNIVMLYKNKEDGSDCNRGIFLLNNDEILPVWS